MRATSALRWLVVLLLCASCARGDDGPSVVVTLACDGPVRVRDPDVPITARITNVSDERIVLVGNLDGSMEACRYPHLLLEFTRADGTTVERIEDLVGCGHVDVLQPKHLIEVLPGESFDPFARVLFFPPFIFGVPLEPGAYTMRLRYRTDAPDLEAWTNARAANPQVLTEDMHAQLAAIETVDIVSNEVTVTVVER